VLTGIGAARLARMLAGRLPMPYPAAAIAGLLIVQFTWYLPWVRAVGEEAWAARADVAFAREAAGELPPNAVVLTHNPGMFHLWGVSAAQLSLASTDPDYVRDVLRPRYSGGIYAHWNFWCNVPDPVQRGFCDRGLAAYPAALVRERRVRDFRYALFRLEP
jgi:hypothetical protein